MATGTQNKITAQKGEAIVRKHLDNYKTQYFCVESGKIDEPTCVNFLKGKSVDVSGMTLDDMISYIQQNYGDILAVHNGKTHALEVKTEEKYTCNIFCETISNSVKNKPGWYHYLKADKVIYVFLDQPNQINIIDWQKFKNVFTENFMATNRINIAKQEANKAQLEKYDTYAYIVPLSKMMINDVMEIRDI